MIGFGLCFFFTLWYGGERKFVKFALFAALAIFMGGAEIYLSAHASGVIR